MKKDETGRISGRCGESRNAHRILVGKYVVKRPLGRAMRRGEYNIKMDLEL
jgi:hypothetical protein